MKKKYLVLIMCIFVSITGCQKYSLTEKSETKGSKVNIETQQNNIGIVNSNKENFESYTGSWSENGISHDTILSEGGTEFCFTIKNGNELEGSLFSQQAITDRIAEIDNIKCNIKNGKCTYRFEDDGWKGTGTLFVTFSDDEIIIDVQNYKMDDKNLSGFGISGKYIFEREKKEEETNTENEELDLFEKISSKYYSMTSDEMMTEINKRRKYCDACSYFKDVSNYLENVREVRDIANVVEPLYYTDMKYYSKEDFKDVPLLIIHLAKNEIYAMHGYIFKNEDLNNYFRGQLWYEPLATSENFDVGVFNEYEKANLKILSELDTYK